MTLNLHGYHPMDEKRRLIQVKDDELKLADSYLFYFTDVEIIRGHEKRQKVLANHLRNLRPDLLFLQEVGGGEIAQNKNCDSFYRKNTASDLGRRVGLYRNWTACRGNLGWWTDSFTFDEKKIFPEASNELVFTRGDNPYPNGMIIEGLAVLTSSAIDVQEHVKERVAYNNGQSSLYFQMLKFRHTKAPQNWYLAVNIHAAHMIEHFEQAVALRRFLSAYLQKQNDLDNFRGFIIAGDFNAMTPMDEVSTVPWSFGHAWQTRAGLFTELIKLNKSNYKPRLRMDSLQAEKRSRQSVEGLFDWFSWPRHPLDSSLHEVSLVGPCQRTESMQRPFCKHKEKIDHIFVSDPRMIQNYSLLYQHHNWTDLKDSVSDHPGVFTIFKIVE